MQMTGLLLATGLMIAAVGAAQAVEPSPILTDAFCFDVARKVHARDDGLFYMVTSRNQSSIGEMPRKANIYEMFALCQARDPDVVVLTIAGPVQAVTPPSEVTRPPGEMLWAMHIWSGSGQGGPAVWSGFRSKAACDKAIPLTAEFYNGNTYTRPLNHIKCLGAAADVDPSEEVERAEYERLRQKFGN